MFREADSQCSPAFLQDLSGQTMLCKLFLIVYATTLVLKAASHHNGPTVHVQQGTLTGTYLTSRYGRKFAAFQGIPYAQPPTGDLRFQVRAINFKISKHYCCIFKSKLHVYVFNTVLFLIGYNVRRTSSNNKVLHLTVYNSARCTFSTPKNSQQFFCMQETNTLSNRFIQLSYSQMIGQ